METILEYMLNNWPTLAIILIVGVTCFIIARKFTRWEDKHDSMHKEISQRICNAKCDSHDSDITILKQEVRDMQSGLVNINTQSGLHDNDINQFKQDWKDIKSDIVAIKSLLLMKHKNAADLFSVKMSPRRLNDNGKELLSDISGMDFLKNNKDFFFAKIDEIAPKTALDVENAANIVCTANTENPIFNGMKNFVYNSPTRILKDSDGEERPYDISMSDVCFVLSIPLRDMYLSEHSEISQK